MRILPRLFCLLAASLLLAPALVTSQSASSPLIISEFRLRGPNGNTDEFIEIYNASGAAHTVAAVSGTGYGIAASDGITRCSIPNGTVIPAGGHFLCANSIGYTTLASYPAGNGTTATPDAVFTTGINDNAGIAIFNNNTGGAAYNLANRFDAVGSTSEANTLYKEGTGWPALTPFSIDHSFYRTLCPRASSTVDPLCSPSDAGLPQDTDDNALDFVFVDTNGTSAGAGQRLGAPGPENSSSPGRLASGPLLGVALIDPVATATQEPNLARDTVSQPANNATFGSLYVRRTIINNTGAPVTRLRFRVADIATFPAPVGTADLRPINSVAVTVTRANGSTVTAQGLTLEQPPAQPNGTGFNGSLSAGTVALATPLANGDSLHVQFRMGIQQTGTFTLGIAVETLPYTSSALIVVSGNTQNVDPAPVDSDDDGIADDVDNCPSTPNADQANNDGDAQGDACDPDDDNDGVADGMDNCPFTPNADQADTDTDGIGNACDTLVGPPANKDQCKNGGWMLFNHPRTFKNQGDCIQFVNTGK
ncbi:MAG TPA: lamin tail domain-containing protein [Pyrinomonadaceae bacterium]